MLYYIITYICIMIFSLSWNISSSQDEIEYHYLIVFCKNN